MNAIFVATISRIFIIYTIQSKNLNYNAIPLRKGCGIIKIWMSKRDVTS